MSKDTRERIIYLITNKVNGKVYVGQTVGTLNERWSGHKSEARTDKRKGQAHNAFHNALNRYGFDNFTREVIKTGIHSIHLADHWEVFWIRHYMSYVGWTKEFGYNSTTGGGSCEGLKGKLHPNYRCTPSDEALDMASETKKILTDEVIEQAFSLYNEGKTMSDVSNIVGIHKVYLSNLLNKKPRYMRKPKYDHLVKRQQPTSRRVVTVSVAERIYELNNLGMLNPEIAKEVGLNKETVLRTLNKIEPYMREPQYAHLTKRDIRDYGRSLSDSQLEKMFSCHNSGMSIQDIASLIKVSRSTVIVSLNKKASYLQQPKYDYLKLDFPTKTIENIPYDTVEKVWHIHNTTDYSQQKIGEMVGLYAATVGTIINRSAPRYRTSEFAHFKNERKSVSIEELFLKAKKMREQGHSNVEIAKAVDRSTASISIWFNKPPKCIQRLLA